MQNFYKKFIHPDDLCFDIGANIGERTSIFLSLHAKVVLVEPQKKCFDFLQKKYAHNTSVKLMNCALGSSQRESELFICEETTECATLSTEFINTYTTYSGLHWREKQKIQVTTLDQMIEMHGLPKFIKIDVEGYESEVFKGLSNKIKYIAFEFNRPLINDTLASLEILEQIGYCRCNFIKYERMSLILDKWLPIPEFKNQLNEIITKDILTGEIIIEYI